MKGWKALFRSHILERGWNYYEMGALESVEKTESGYHAVVEGSEDYDVEIEIRDGRIDDMYCSCPYAEDGNYCKHMAAVLYEIENGVENILEDGIRKTDEKYSELKELVAGIPEKELRELLVDLAQADKSLYSHLQMKYAPVSPEQVMELKNQVDEIAYRHSDRSGFIDYRNAWDYTNALRDFLYHQVQILIDKNYLDEAFEVTNYVFHEIGNCDMDDSEGGSTEVACICYDFWKQILENSNEEQKDKMFQWFLEHEKSYVMDFMQEYMDDFLMDEFHDEEMLENRLRLLDEEIEKAGESVDCGSRYSVHYAHVNNILKRMDIMRKLGNSEQEILDYRKKHRRFSEIRKLEIQDYMHEKKYEKAIEVLKESKVLDREFAGLISEYSMQLLHIYEKTEQKEEYKKELIYQIFECAQRDLVNIFKLKQICGQSEWEAYREKALASETLMGVRYELLEKEGLYERLLYEVQKNGYIYSLNRYEKVLNKKFPEEVKNMYINYVKNAVKHAASRKAYQELMKYLKKIAKYKGGRQNAEEIASDWRREYKRRSAMMDELRKVGF